jgi:ATP-dependent DNA ligase
MIPLIAGLHQQQLPAVSYRPSRLSSRATTKLIYAAKVRNGFIPNVRQDVLAKFKKLETETCFFSNLSEKKHTQWALTREEMENCHWLRPELVAPIEFTERTPDN